MKLLARCAAPTAAAGSTTGKTTGRLPIELVTEQVRRLAIFSAVLGALWTYGLLVDLVDRAAVRADAADGSRRRDADRDRRDPAVGGGVDLHALLAAPAETKSDRWPRLHDRQRGRDRACSNRVMVPTHRRPRHAAVVDHQPDSRPLDDRADDDAADARGLTGGRVDGSARRLVRTSARPADADVRRDDAAVPAELHRGVHRGDSGQDPASHQPPPARGAGDGQLSADRAARPRRHGRGVARASIACSRATPRSRLVRPEMLGAGSAADGQTIAAPLRTRSAGDRGAQLAAHDSRLRLRHDRRGHVLLRDGAARRPRSRDRWSASSGRCRPNRAVFLLRQVCHSLADAHARGLVHRDIKPANIFTLPRWASSTTSSRCSTSAWSSSATAARARR